MRIKHIAIRVRDLEKSISFYEAITKMEVLQRKKEAGAELAFMGYSGGGTELELICIPGDKTFEGRGMFICFETDRIDEMHTLAQEGGYNPSPVQDPGDKTRYFYVYDPDGVSVQLRSF